MSAFLVILAEAAACLGYGAAVLALLGTSPKADRLTQAGRAFALGFGLLGWLTFFLAWWGWLGQVPLLLLLAAGWPGVALLARNPWPQSESLSLLEWGLLALLVLAVSAQLVTDLCPPSDGDTLAYHFANTKAMLAGGRMEFIARGIDGAVPLLVQMTYLPVFGLGGERALGLWPLVTWLASGWLMYGYARPNLPRSWALAVTMAFMTIPATIYGAASGQVEVRLAMFATVSAFAAADCLRTGKARHAVLAGLAGGFYMGGKYIGLLAVACMGAILLMGRRPRVMAAFAMAALLAGSQWYVWNYAHTGDPVFPLFYRVLGTSAELWNDTTQADMLKDFHPGELPLPRDILHLLAYPLYASLGLGAVPDTGRVGPGPLLLILLPLAAAGAWRRRSVLLEHPLAPVAALAALFYAAWFLSGASQRPRHLVPMLPTMLICLTVAARAAAQSLRPLSVAIALTLVVQVAGTLLFARGFAPYALGRESRDQFLARMVTGYDLVRWANANLPAGAVVGTDMRPAIYLFDTHVYWISQYQARIYAGRGDLSPAALWHQLRGQRITHLVMLGELGDPERRSWVKQLPGLAAAGCLEQLVRMPVAAVASRSGFSGSNDTMPGTVLRLSPETCRFQGGG